MGFLLGRMHLNLALEFIFCYCFENIISVMYSFFFGLCIHISKWRSTNDFWVNQLFFGESSYENKKTLIKNEKKSWFVLLQSLLLLMSKKNVFKSRFMIQWFYKILNASMHSIYIHKRKLRHIIFFCIHKIISCWTAKLFFSP